MNCFEDYFDFDKFSLHERQKAMICDDWMIPTEEQLKLRELAKQYHERCDAYDVTVCTAKSRFDGEPMPIDGYEQGLVSRNAKEVRQDIIMQGYDMGFTEEDIAKAIKDYVKR